MRNIFVPLALAVFLGSGAILYAAGQAPMPADYDEDTYGPWAPVIWVKPVKSVIFEHKIHTVDAGLDCDSCHDDLFAMEAGAAEENDDFTMETLYAGGYCGACHDGATAFASDTRCTACHIGVRGHARIVGSGDGQGSGH